MIYNTLKSDRAPRFKGFQQQDSHELLHYLLDGVKAEEIKVRAQANNISIIRNIEKYYDRQITLNINFKEFL